MLMDYKYLPKEEFTRIYHIVPRAAVDIIVACEKGIILTKRSIPPHIGKWHIPGGTILFLEPVQHTIDRVLENELGIKAKEVKQFGMIEYYEEDGRHTVSNVFTAKIESGSPKGSEQGEEWGYFKEIPDFTIPEQKKFLEENWEEIKRLIS